MSTYTRKTTIRELSEKGFSSLEVSCRRCPRKVDEMLQLFPATYALEFIRETSVCSNCQQVGVYVMPQMVRTVRPDPQTGLVVPCFTGTEPSELSNAYEQIFVDRAKTKIAAQFAVAENIDLQTLNPKDRDALVEYEAMKMKDEFHGTLTKTAVKVALAAFGLPVLI